MADSTRSLVKQALLLGVAAMLLWAGARTAWRIQVAADLTRRSEPLQHAPAQPRLRLLVVGDSTAVGTGASGPSTSVVGLLAQAFPGLLIENRARDGAMFGAVVDQLAGDAAFDMVLVMAGGNDVVRLRGLQAMQADIDRTVARARERAALVVLLPAGNVGNAPFFYPPVSWLMTWRARRLHGFVQQAAARHGALVVNLFRARSADPFVQQPALNAADGLHPADAGYRVWFDELVAQAGLAQRLAAAAPVPAPAAAPSR